MDRVHEGSAQASRKSARHRAATSLVAATLVGIGSLVAVPAAQAAATDITSAGPLTKISISDELELRGEPNRRRRWRVLRRHRLRDRDRRRRHPLWTVRHPRGEQPGAVHADQPVPVTGAGTVGDPYKIVTVVDAGTSGLRLTQTDTYVTGRESYQTDVTVANNGVSAASTIVYRGGDCYLQNDDRGFGSVGNPAGAVACVAAADPN